MKRFFASLLCVLMLVSLLPLGVWAEDGEADDIQPAPVTEAADAEPTETPAPEAPAAPAEETPADEPETPEDGPAEEAAPEAGPETPEEAPAQDPLPEEASEAPEENAPEEAPVFPWAELTDGEFLAWIFAPENAAYIKALLAHTSAEEYAAFTARVKALTGADRVAAENALTALAAGEAPVSPEARPAEETEETPEAPAAENELSDGPEEASEEEPFAEEPPAEEEEKALLSEPLSGTCGEDLTWEYAEGVLTISGSGAMYEYKQTMDLPWYGFREEITSLVLNEGLTYISGLAFYNAPVASVTLPESLTGIGASAFFNTEITSLDIPAAVTTIGGRAFSYCTLLNAVTGMEGVTVLPRRVFGCCYKLTSIELPAGLTEVGEQAFNSCGSADDPLVLRFAGAAPSFGEYCFERAYIRLYYPAACPGWTEAESAKGQYASSGNTEWIACGTAGEALRWEVRNNTLVISGTGAIPDYPETGAPWAVCTDRFTRVRIGTGITRIGNNAFAGCGDTELITFTGSAPGFAEGCFSDFEAVISYPGTDTSWTGTVRQNYGGDPAWIADTDLTCGTGLSWTLMHGVLTVTGTGAIPDDPVWQAGAEKTETVVIGEGVTGIGRSAFEGCTGMTRVSLPQSLKTIGEKAFCGCSALQQIMLPPTVTALGASAFKECVRLASVALPAGVTALGDSVFYGCTGLKTAVLSDRVKAIPKDAFRGCTGLMRVTVPASAETVGESAFSGCISLASVTVLNGVKTIGNYAFNECPALSSLVIPASVVQIGAYAFMIGEESRSVPASDSITFCGSAPTFGSSCFGDRTLTAYYPQNDPTWTADKKDQYGGNITWIGMDSYRCGENMSCVLLDGMLVLTGTGAMYDFESPEDMPWYAHRDEIRELTVPAGVTYIGVNAFNGCDKLETVRYEGTDWADVTVARGNAPLSSARILVSVPMETVRILCAGEDISCQETYTDTDLYPTLQLCAELAPATGASIAWTSSDPAVATVDETGKLTFTGTGTVTVTARTDNCGSAQTTFTVFSGAVLLTLDKTYLLLVPGEEARLGLTVTPAALAGKVQWLTDSDCVTVSGKGGLLAKKQGMAYITAVLTIGGRTYYADCRVDVAASEEPIAAQVSEVQLITVSATAQVFKADPYPTVSILPVLAQNLAPQSPAEEQGPTIGSARFVSETVSQFFSLRVKDGRTLEIVPTVQALKAALSGNKSLRSSYTSGITVKIGEEEYTTSASLKLTVKKTKPAVKAKAITFNSLLPEEKIALQFTGAKVTGIEPDETAAAGAKTDAIPPYILLDGETGTVSLRPDAAAYASRGSLYLLLTLEGWSASVSVKVPFTVKRTAPKLSFSEKNVTLLQGSTDTARVQIRVTPAIYADADQFPVTVTGIEVMSGTGYARLENSMELTCFVSGRELVLRAGRRASDGKAHTYRVKLNCLGSSFTYTVKTRAAGTDPQFSVRTAGTVNTLIPDSPVVFTLTPKNYHAGSGETYSLVKIRQYGKTSVNEYEGAEAIAALFRVRQAGNVFTLTEKAPGTLQSGYTYKAEFGVDLDNDGMIDNTATAALKITFAKTAPAIILTAKAKGSIDVARPGTAITVTPTLKNWYGSEEKRLVFFEKVGKTDERMWAGTEPFEWTANDDGTFTVTAGEGLTAPVSKYSVAVCTRINGEEKTSNHVKLSVKQGPVKVKSSAASLTLHKKDRFSRAVFTLSIADGTVKPMAYIDMDAASAQKFRLIELGNGAWALGYKDNTLPASFRASTVKLSVYAQDCDAPLGTVKLKVSYK